MNHKRFAVCLVALIPIAFVYEQVAKHYALSETHTFLGGLILIVVLEPFVLLWSFEDELRRKPRKP